MKLQNQQLIDIGIESGLDFILSHLAGSIIYPNRADKNSNSSFKSCLLRIPGSINLKYGNKVSIVKRWNGHRPLITKDLLIEFRRYLIQKKIGSTEANTKNTKWTI